MLPAPPGLLPPPGLYPPARLLSNATNGLIGAQRPGAAAKHPIPYQKNEKKPLSILSEITAYLGDHSPTGEGDVVAVEPATNDPRLHRNSLYSCSTQPLGADRIELIVRLSTLSANATVCKGETIPVGRLHPIHAVTESCKRCCRHYSIA